MSNRRLLILICLVVFILLISSCKNQSDSNNEINNSVDSYKTNISENISDEKSKPLSGVDENNELQSVSNVNKEHESGSNDNVISVSIFGDETLLIDKSRFNDDIYGSSQLDNRWSLNEIDVILNSIKGDWKIDKYIGFVVSSIYYADLYNQSDNIEEDVRNNLIEEYNKKLECAKNNIPDVSFSVRRHNEQDINSNYIIVNGNYLSPISIILSMDRMDENYPVFVDRTTLSIDFIIEYPVIYIKFLIKYSEDNLEDRYEPATLVLTKDDKFYILMDGAFYSVGRKP